MAQYNYAGFVSQEVYKLQLDDIDLHILSYIQMIMTAQGIEHIEYNEELYFYITYDKLLADNLTLMLKRRGLEKRISLLEQKGLISKVCKVDNVKKLYIRTTDVFMRLRFDYSSIVDKKDINEKPKLQIQVQPKLNETELIESEVKEKRIISMVQEKKLNEFTDYAPLKEALVEFVKMRKKLKKPMTDRAFEMLLNKLKELSNSVGTQLEIVNQSILFSYQSVYPLSEKYMNEKQKTKQYNYDEECDF